MSDIIEAPEAPRVLVVDDEPQILMIMRFTLETAGFVVVCAADGAQAWSLFKQQSFDLVVLDLMIPTVSGVTVTERIRTVSEVPIMMITALSDEPDRIRRLEAGADDYITKPFSPRELTLRAQALVRRWRGQHTPVLTNGDLVIDTASHRAHLRSSTLDITDTEIRFLEVMARNIDRVVTYRDLLSQAWGTEDRSGGKDMIKTTAYRVRRALGEEGRRYIHLVRGEGYTMPRLERSTLGGTPSTSTEPEQVAPHPITVTHHGNGDVTKPTVTDHHPAGPHHQE